MPLLKVADASYWPSSVPRLRPLILKSPQIHRLRNVTFFRMANLRSMGVRIHACSDQGKLCEEWS